MDKNSIVIRMICLRKLLDDHHCSSSALSRALVQNARGQTINTVIMENVKSIQRRYTSPVLKIASFILLILMLYNPLQMNAQLPGEVTSAKTGTINAGSLLTQLMNAIKPSSFTDQWQNEKSNWLSSVAKIAGAPGMIENVSSLATFIKPSMFRDGFNLQNFLETASKATSIADATGLMKNLEGGLKPEAMVSDWGNKKNGWLNALNLLKF